ncbi:hypothetical protein TRFO_26050 [Tritrichomonas foetus]|uniref:F5/8 type C domain-containing protein n=1 Tax=Tritrichomonas foetus TaxID=1144522 RepID=A0A1J4K469_9EUKA|nr:hypothetical protein TRFO_26050 [Tritrichomonas foetus]|eukprot:OHT05987.1 hypothetical protein TRFO_26050 [Tritrichomonas foetus]
MSDFSLSREDLDSKLNFNSYDQDFTFFIGDQPFQCNIIIAEMVSPNVRKIRQTDSSVDSYVIPHDPNYNTSYFDLILKTGKFETIKITEKNIKSLQYYYKMLGNSEFSDHFINTSNKKDKTTISNVITQLKLRLQINLSINQEIEFISSHVYALEDQLSKENLTIDVLSAVFGHPKLCISSEEWLFNFIIEKISKEGSVYSSLFEYVDLNALSKDSLTKFFNRISLDEVNYPIWNSIIKLCLDNKKSNTETTKVSEKSKRYYVDPKVKVAAEKEAEEARKKQQNLRILNIDFNNRNPWSGVFFYLTQVKNSQRNIAETGMIEITASSQNNEASLFHLVDEAQSVFVSDNMPNQWIKFDFKERRIVPRCYTLMTHHRPAHMDHLRSWVIEVSEDNIHFEEVMREINNVTLDNPGNVVVYRIDRHIKGRYVRIRMIGPNWCNSNVFAISRVEFFGSLFEKGE